MKKNIRIASFAMALLLSVQGFSVAAMAEDGTKLVNNDDGTVSEITTETDVIDGDGGSETTIITITEEISGTNNEGKVVEGEIINIDKKVADSDGHIGLTETS